MSRTLLRMLAMFVLVTLVLVADASAFGHRRCGRGGCGGGYGGGGCGGGYGYGGGYAGYYGGPMYRGYAYGMPTYNVPRIIYPAPVRTVVTAPAVSPTIVAANPVP